MTCAVDLPTPGMRLEPPAVGHRRQLVDAASVDGAAAFRKARTL